MDHAIHTIIIIIRIQGQVGCMSHGALVGAGVLEVTKKGTMGWSGLTSRAEKKKEKKSGTLLPSTKPKLIITD